MGLISRMTVEKTNTLQNVNGKSFAGGLPTICTIQIWDRIEIRFQNDMVRTPTAHCKCRTWTWIY